MLVVSSREFRDNQKNYLDQVDEGVEILIQRGKNKSYKIVPVTEDDTVIDKKYILAPDDDFYRAIPLEDLLPKIEADIKVMYKKGKK